MCTTLLLLCHDINVAMVNAETALICADITKKKKTKKTNNISISFAQHTNSHTRD